MIYDMGQRSTSVGDRDGRHFYREPAVVLDFGPKGALGTVHFSRAQMSVPMHQYLRKVSLFGGYVFFLRWGCWGARLMGPRPTAQVPLPKVHGFGWKGIQVESSHGRRTRMDGKDS